MPAAAVLAILIQIGGRKCVLEIRWRYTQIDTLKVHTQNDTLKF